MRYVAGAKQVSRALTTRHISRLIVARDAQPYVTRKPLELAKQLNIPVKELPTMAEIGALCGLKVGAAVAAEIIEQ